MIDFETITLDEVLSRSVAIDTEYHTDHTGAIDRVYCVCASNRDGKQFKRWLYPYNDNTQMLKEIAEYFEIPDPIFIAHAYDIAERQAFVFLQANPYQYDWVCTFHLARLCTNAFVFGSLGLGYAALCKRCLGVSIDTDHKEAMRALCVQNRAEGHEHEILEYCASDTVYLIPLMMKLLEIYEHHLRKARLVFGSYLYRTALALALYQCRLLSVFGKIADRGFPVDSERVRTMKKGAVVMRDRLFTSFSQRYPGTYTKIVKTDLLAETLGQDFADRLRAGDADAWRDAQDAIEREFGDDKRQLSRIKKVLAKASLVATKAKLAVKAAEENPWHANTKVIQAYLSKFLEEKGMLASYPRTETGKLKTDSETLSEWCKGGGGFGEDLYRVNRDASLLKGCSKDWVKTLKGDRLKYRTLRPYASATGRCQGKPSDGFVLAWSHYLYGVLNPPQGKWLVELDYTSEETGIQAMICRDPAYKEAYNSKDIYLYIGSQIGMIPRADYDSLSTKELKEKYHSIRSKLKTFVLAWSYGCGVAKLASKVGISKDKAEKIKLRLNAKLFKKSTDWKMDLVDKQHFSESKAKLYTFSKKKMFLSLPDGWVCRTAAYDGEKTRGQTSVQNWPFQSCGAYILRQLVLNLEPVEEVEVVATMHDAILFLVPEGRMDIIDRVKKIMADTANTCLGAKEFIRVGDPEIIKHGDVWTPECENTAKFLDLMQAGDPDGWGEFTKDIDDNTDTIDELPVVGTEEVEDDYRDCDLSTLEWISDKVETAPDTIVDEFGVEVINPGAFDSAMFEL